MTPSPPADTLWSQFIALAGALAEEGVQTIDLIPVAGPRRSCHARSTDLPATIAALAPGDALEAPAIALHLRRDGDRLTVLRADSPIASRVAATVGQRA